MQEALVRLQQQLLQADKINAGGSAPRQHKGGGNDGGSPLFSDDQGVPSPLPPPMAFAGTGSAADGCAESTQVQIFVHPSTIFSYADRPS